MPQSRYTYNRRYQHKLQMSKRYNEESSLNNKKQKLESEVMKSIQKHIKSIKTSRIPIYEPTAMKYFIGTLAEYNIESIMEAEDLFRARSTDLSKVIKETESIYKTNLQKAELTTDETTDLNEVFQMDIDEANHDIEYYRLLISKLQIHVQKQEYFLAKELSQFTERIKDAMNGTIPID